MVKLCLGTVQFGMKYGINNQFGQPSKEDVFFILDEALEKGIETIDTANAYGCAEDILGKYMTTRKLAGNIKIISKLKPNVIDAEPERTGQIIEREINASLQKLTIECLDGYLLHSPRYVYNDDILNALFKAKKNGKTNHIGVSIYEMEEGFQAIDTGVIDYIQLPYSIFDQRGLHSGFIEKAKNAGITVFARSAFLQGLFMMSNHLIPAFLSGAVAHLETFEMLLETYKIDRISALIGFVTANTHIDYLVFGVDNISQLHEDIIKFHGKPIPDAMIDDMKACFSEMDKSVIIPSLWAKN